MVDPHSLLTFILSTVGILAVGAQLHQGISIGGPDGFVERSKSPSIYWFWIILQSAFILVLLLVRILD